MDLLHPGEICNTGISLSGRFTEIKKKTKNNSSVWNGTLNDGELIEMSPSPAKLDLFLFALQKYEVGLKLFDARQQERSANDSSAGLVRLSSC